MNTGLLDLPGFLLGPADRMLEAVLVPALIRVFLWGALAGYAGMWLYRRRSPQQRIAELRVELARVQQQLSSYDGEFSGLMPLIRRQFGLALRQMRLTAGAALLAAVPILLVLPWLSNRYALETPDPGSSIAVCVVPAPAVSALDWNPPRADADAQGCWNVPWPAAGSQISLKEHDHEILQWPRDVPAPLLHKHHWLNWLVGNPAGYLPAESRIERLDFGFRPVEFIAWGPSWLRGWEAAFFLSALIVSLYLRWRWKLQ
jgi:hypothetical protein